MMTLFMPMAPNPVMGGFVIHVDRERVFDIDISVEEGIQSIVTSGVTAGGKPETSEELGLDPEEIASIGGESQAERRFTEEDAVFQPQQVVPDRAEEYNDRAEEYNDRVDPEHARTPRGMARREREEGVRGREMDGRPARRADRDPD